jgi:hypothetical protein
MNERKHTMTYQPAHYYPQGERDRRRRLEDQLRRLGTRNPECSDLDCGERDPFALTGSIPDLMCYEHQSQSENRAWVEGHHVAAAANDPDTIAPIPGNDHRVLSDLQQDWPADTLRNPNTSPLIRAAAAIRGWLDVLWVILTRSVGWIPAALEQLDVLLTGHVGSGWWRTVGWRSDDDHLTPG